MIFSFSCCRFIIPIDYRNRRFITRVFQSMTMMTKILTMSIEKLKLNWNQNASIWWKCVVWFQFMFSFFRHECSRQEKVFKFALLRVPFLQFPRWLRSPDRQTMSLRFWSTHWKCCVICKVFSMTSWVVWRLAKVIIKMELHVSDIFSVSDDGHYFYHSDDSKIVDHDNDYDYSSDYDRDELNSSSKDNYCDNSDEYDNCCDDSDDSDDCISEDYDNDKRQKRLRRIQEDRSRLCNECILYQIYIDILDLSSCDFDMIFDIWWFLFLQNQASVDRSNHFSNFFTLILTDINWIIIYIW